MDTTTKMALINGEKSVEQQILDEFENKQVKAIRIEVADGYGVPRCRLIPASGFGRRIIEGQSFPGCCFASLPSGCRIKDIDLPSSIVYGDMYAMPDLDTITLLPHCKDFARVIAQPMVDGREYAKFIPRYVAIRQLDRLAEMGLSLLSGYEHEFILFNEANGHKIGSIVDERRVPLEIPRLSAAGDFVDQILEDLPKMGLEVDAIETEGTPGMLEVTCKPAFGIKGADNAYICKTAVKEIARKNGLVASFMTRPLPSNDTTTAHFNHSLWGGKGGRVPMLLDESRQLSEIATNWIAGLVAHARGIAALMAPTVNCIRAFDGSKPLLEFIPTTATWGVRNRTVSVNFKLADDAEGSYVENRMGMGGSNPYIVLAATVAAGLDGIARKLSLPPAVTESAHLDVNTPPLTPKLPSNMKEAVRALRDDKVIREALGEEFISWFIAAKQHEQEASASASDPMKWEKDLFFESI